jgi:hypothetical protein
MTPLETVRRLFAFGFPDWRRSSRPFPLWLLLASLLSLPDVAPAASLIAGPGGGFRIISMKPSPNAGPRHAVSSSSVAANSSGNGVESPPAEGPVISLAITVTDLRQDDTDWFATAEAGVSGSALTGATTNVIFGYLDSGSSTHLVDYPDALAMGLQDSFIGDNSFPVSGVDGVQVDLDISVPVGFFAQGMQDLDAVGQPQPALMFGQGNFAAGVNSLDNYNAGINPPTLIGAPFLFFFPAYIQNSQPVQSSVLGNSVSSPSVTFYGDPQDPQIPALTHTIFLQTRPTGAVSVTYLLLLDEFPFVPSTMLLGDLSSALYFTASSMAFQEGTYTSSGAMLVDTGAQITLLSEIAAAELNLDLQHPDFTVEVQGLVNTITAPGFYIDSASVPALGGAVTWTNVPVIIVNVASPEGGTLYGIFGSNLTARRDLVFNGAASTPYLSVTDPIVPSRLQITGIRSTGTNSAEIDWHTEPAPPVLYLDMCTNLALNPPQWIPVATNSLATINGTMSVTGLGERNFFRLRAPQ